MSEPQRAREPSEPLRARGPSEPSEPVSPVSTSVSYCQCSMSEPQRVRPRGGRSQPVGERRSQPVGERRPRSREGARGRKGEGEKGRAACPPMARRDAHKGGRGVGPLMQRARCIVSQIVSHISLSFSDCFSHFPLFLRLLLTVGGVGPPMQRAREGWAGSIHHCKRSPKGARRVGGSGPPTQRAHSGEGGCDT